MSRVFYRRALERAERIARVTKFTLDDLLEAVQQQDDTPYVYADVDDTGRVSGACGTDVARVCVRAALAPTALARTARLALLTPAPHARTRTHALELRVDTQHELLLWFDEQLLAAIDMPFLTLRNIRGRQHYHCHLCGERFNEPNPLKVHLFMNCFPPDPVRFWREVISRVRGAAPAPPVQPPGPLAAAQLEALATEWGRSCGGRLGHVCVYCGKLYSRRYGLKIHLRTHTGYRPLRCRYCLRAFGDPSNLNKHVRLHAARASSAHTHTCTVCGRALARRRDLERHLRAHALTQH